MTPFPAILALWDSQVHICPTYCGDKTSHIELSIDDFLSIGIILCVPNVDLYNGYIWFQQNLYNSRFGGKNDIIEYVIDFEDAFNFLRWYSYIQLLADVGDTYDLEI